MSSPQPPPPPPPPLRQLDVTVVSAKHLKNVNWRNGSLSPYAVISLSPNAVISTRPDSSGSTRPVWNERFLLPLRPSHPPHFLTLEIYHSRPSDTAKPLVGSLRITLPDPNDPDPDRVQSFDLRRPSGRPHGKIRLKLALVENYQFNPPLPCYYPSAPTPPPLLNRSFSGYYSDYFPPPRRPWEGGFVGPPSGPVEYAPYERNEQRGIGNVGPGEGYAGAMGGRTLEEGVWRGEKINLVTHDGCYLPPRPFSDRRGGYDGSSSDPDMTYDPNEWRRAANVGRLGSPVEYTTYERNEGRGVGNVGHPSAPVEYASYDRNERRGNGNVGHLSAPVEYTVYNRNEQRAFGSVGSVAGLEAMRGLTLEEGVRRERESDLLSTDGYSKFRGNYGYN